MSTDQEPIRTTSTSAAAGSSPGPYTEPPRRYDDEISLRELYLILKRGLPLIVGLAVLAGVVAALFLWLRPAGYEAEATVVSNPTSVQIQDQGTLGFAPENAIPFATYEALAQSRATMEATLDLLADEGPDTFRALQGAADLEQLTGPTNSNPNAALTVVHRVTWGDPDLAARFADAWAATTVDQVRNTLLANLAPARDNITATIETRRGALESAEDAWQEFLETDASTLEMRLSGFDARITQADARLAALDREIAAASARREVLLAQLGDVDAAATVDEDTLALLEGAGALDPETASRLRRLATDANEADGGGANGGGGGGASVAALLARADLQRESVELGGMIRERAHLEASLEDYGEQAAEVRSRLAALETRETRLQRELTTARQAYDSVAAIEPVLAFVADLTPGNTRVLNEAQVPAGPSGPSTALVVALATIVMAMAATVFVFLREAVREPTPAR